MTPATLLRIQSHDLRDALADLCGDVPPDADQMTTQDIDTLLRDLRACESRVWEMRLTLIRRDECAALRGMARAIGPTSYEWAWEQG